MATKKTMKPVVGPGAGVIAAAMNVGEKGARAPYQPRQRTAGRDVVAMTVYCPRATHEKLRELAAAKSTSLQQIMAAAVDLWLMREGQAFGFYPRDEGGAQ
jgi:hypothetical protein